MRRKAWWIWGLCAVSLLLMAAAGCTQFADSTAPQTTVFPSGDYGEKILDLYQLIFWMAVVVFIGTEGLLLYAIVRFRRRSDDEMPAQTHGNMRLEVTWTVLPSVVLLIIAVPTIGTIFATDAPPPVISQHIVVTGHQWWWEFEYKDLGFLTANEVHLPIGQAVEFDLKSADVVHSFWIPKMGGKVDVFPARSNRLFFTPKETGEFYGQCVEFCGTQHANMRLRLFVHSEADFKAWADRERQPASPPSAGVAQGAEAFQARGCPACHTIRGTNAKGAIGPDLTHVGARKTIGAGILDNTSDNLVQWIRDPQGVKVGNKMIALPMNDADRLAIAVYLRTLQ